MAPLSKILGTPLKLRIGVHLKLVLVLDLIRNFFIRRCVTQATCCYKAGSGTKIKYASNCRL